MAIQSLGAFAFRRPFSAAIVFNRSDVGKDRVTNGRAIGGTRTLSGVIALETTHIMTDAEAALLRKADPAAPALVYYHARQRVSTALRAKRGSVDAFFAGG